MIHILITPKFRGFICAAAHPKGCAEHVRQQIEYVKAADKFIGPKRALVIGSSTGYGLASQIALTFGADTDTIGVFLERPYTEKRPASAGWYNMAAFTKAAKTSGRRAFNINGDAFSTEIKREALDLIKKEFGQIDCLIYSLASPRRIHPLTGKTYSSVLKPINTLFFSKTVDFHTEAVSNISIEPATADEIEGTIAVMGGEDWQMWIEALLAENLLAEGATTLNYSYVGPELTYPIYRFGTIGHAKADSEQTAVDLNKQLQKIGGKAKIAVNKAVVTQASAAIPVVPLYISLLFKVMKDQGIHEGCIEQMYRLFSQSLNNEGSLDREGRIRMDDWELRDSVQEKIAHAWMQVSTENMPDVSDIAGFRQDFFRLFGFGFENIDYELPVDIAVDFS